jgi:hypothetical protein
LVAGIIVHITLSGDRVLQPRDGQMFEKGALLEDDCRVAKDEVDRS